MDPKFIKALLMQAAYTGACAVCEPLISNPDGTAVKLDSLVQDMGLQNKGVLVYEEAKIQYAVILKAFADQTGIWPDPVLPASSQASSPGVSVKAGNTQVQVTQNAIQAAIQTLLSQIPGSTPVNTVGGLLQAIGALATQGPTGTQPASTPAAPASPATTPSK